MQITQYIDRTPAGYEKITITNAAVSRLDATLRMVAKAVFITIEDVGIRYRIDSGDPDANDGHIVITGGNIYIVDPRSIQDMRMISTGADSTAIVTYYI